MLWDKLVGYWDGSLLAYAAMVYIRIHQPGHANVRVTPVAGPTAPRTDQNGGVVLVRTVNNVIASLPEKL